MSSRAPKSGVPPRPATATSPHWTIGTLARHSGVSAQTLRHYDRLGLLRPSRTNRAGYRLYDEGDRVRLELIRTLRALDLDLSTIGQLLRGATTVRRVAELHLQSLDLQARAIARRRAVLNVLLRGDLAPDADRLARLQMLASLERAERARFLATHLDERLRGAGSPVMQRVVRDVAMVDLPDAPTDAQVEAWLELAEMISDPTFLERHRSRPAADGWPSNDGRDARKMWREMVALYTPAAAAARAGVDPHGAKGQAIARRWVRSFARQRGRTASRAFAAEMLRAIDDEHGAREARFWALVGVLKPDVASSPISVAWPWLVEGLRAMVGRSGH